MSEQINKHEVKPLAAPSYAEQIARLHVIRQAAEVSVVLQNCVVGFDMPTRMDELRKCMNVISDALYEGLDEINRCSYESEGKVEPDIWFRLLHHQALIASSWVERETHRAVSSAIWNATFKRSNDSRNY